MMKKAAIALLLTMGLAGPDIARADVTFSYVADSTTYSTGSQTVNVYLQEFVPTGGTSLSQSSGVTGTNIYGFYASTTGGATITNYVSNAAFGSNASADYGLGGSQYDYSAAQTSGTLSGQKLGNGTAVTGGTDYTLKVGTLTVNFTTGSTLTLQSFSAAPAEGPGSDSTYTLPAGASAYDLDTNGSYNSSGTGTGSFHYNGANGQSFTANVASVPEPSSMLLCSLVACGMGYTGYRRRKAPVVVA